jgi:hypothetical protein
MAHVHSHEDRTYYLEQFWTIGTCGALGVVMILLWWYNVLAIFLDPKFHQPVVWGGIALLVLVAVRAVALWVAVARHRVVHGHTHEDFEEPEEPCHEHDCGHDHDHEHEHAHAAADALDGTPEAAVHAHDHAQDHAHEHAHAHAGHDHGHDHGHEHGWQPWRYAVLLIPTVLFLMQIPWPQPEEPPEENVYPVKLKYAEESADDSTKRENLVERMKTNTIRLKGRFAPVSGDNRRFQFARLRMTCCFADAYAEPVSILVESPEPLPLEEWRNRWVKVLGKVEWQPLGENGKPITVVKATRVVPIRTPANQFDNYE